MTDLSFSAESPLTWMDVARTLSNIDPASPYWTAKPATLQRARVNWTGLLLEVSLGTTDESPILDWLEQIFPRRLFASGTGFHIALDGPEFSKELPVEFDQRDMSQVEFQSALGTIDSFIDFRYRPIQRHGGGVLPVVACHSVKGGTGRTTTAIATALAWAKASGKKILLVDADLEAPGLSYLYSASSLETRVSFEDLLALAHSDLSADSEITASFVAGKLQDQRIGDLVFLPLRRDISDLASSSLRWEDLSSIDGPFVLTELLRSVAEQAGCGGVVVDLRAGLVPIATQFITDPTVDTTFVTTLSGQSLKGTASLVDYVAREMRKRGDRLERPLLVVNRIPSVLKETGADKALLQPYLDSITKSILLGYSQEASGDQSLFEDERDIEPFVLLLMPELADLQVTSGAWENFVSQLQNSGFSARLAPSVDDWVGASASDTDALIAIDKQTAIPDVAKKRAALSDFARRLVAAETADTPMDTPLVTGPLRALASQFKNALPIVICEGAKGTGKTLTARFLVKKALWSEAVKALTGEAVTHDGVILPVLGSVQSSPKFQDEIDRQRTAVATAISAPDVPMSVDRLKLRLLTELGLASTDEQRVNVWLDSIAWSSGFGVGQRDVGEAFLKHLRTTGNKVLAIFEGIEELYRNPFAPGAPEALHSLLVDVPQRLRGEPGRSLGLIVFVRRDSVSAAVPQNLYQFRANYEDFALTWSERDVLELAAWLVTKAQSLEIWTPSFRELSKSDQERKLYPLWGMKLGPDDRPGKRTAEAYTANWVIAVLSDLQSRLVARDLIRFLENAAEHTPGTIDPEFEDSRLLVPRAIKAAVKPTSIAKVKETEEEIGELKPVFEKFRSNPDTVAAPINSASLDALSLVESDIDLLRRHGILFGDAPPYEVPELFRMGLNLRHTGARHSVINLRRKALQRLGIRP